MRDPKRIDRILKKLKVSWKKHPDLRLGQIIAVACNSKEISNPVFYTEDETVEVGLERFSHE